MQYAKKQKQQEFYVRLAIYKGGFIHLFRIYSSLIHPDLIYGNIVWGNNYVTRLDGLIKIQKKVVRVITFSLIFLNFDQ